MPDVVEAVRDTVEDGGIGDRSLDELDPTVGWNVFSLRREEVVDHHDLIHLIGQQPPHEVGADEARPTDHQDPA